MAIIDHGEIGSYKSGRLQRLLSRPMKAVELAKVELG